MAQSLLTARHWTSFTLYGTKNPLSNVFVLLNVSAPVPFKNSPGEASAASCFYLHIKLISGQEDVLLTILIKVFDNDSGNGR